MDDNDRNRLYWHYNSLIKKDDFVFDIGMNHGDYTAVLLQLGAKVVAVEPQKHCAEGVRELLGQKCTIIQAACGAKHSMAKIKICATDAMATLSDKFIETAGVATYAAWLWDHEEDVRVITLDSMIEMFGVPKFIKIDVEGWEFEVIKGLHTPVEMISFEYARFDPMPAIKTLKYLDLLGNYKFNFCKADTFKFVYDHEIGVDEMISYMKTLIPSNSIEWHPEINGDIYAFKVKE